MHNDWLKINGPVIKAIVTELNIFFFWKDKTLIVIHFQINSIILHKIKNVHFVSSACLRQREIYRFY